MKLVIIYEVVSKWLFNAMVGQAELNDKYRMG